MAAKIHVERMMHRSSIAILGESAASYALIKLIPSGLGQAAKPMGLGTSPSCSTCRDRDVHEEDGTSVSRLNRVQKAAIAAIQKLKPDDTMTIVAFANNRPGRAADDEDFREGKRSKPPSKTSR